MKTILYLCITNLKNNYLTMELTIKYISEAFSKYNTKYFGGELKKPIFKIGKSKTQLGSFSCHQTMFGEVHTITISKYYDRTPKQYDNTIIHEMIHQYIRQKGLKDSSSHGHLFKQHCARINKDGWDLSRTTNTSHWNVNKEFVKLEMEICVYQYNPSTQFIFRLAHGKRHLFENHFKRHGIKYKFMTLTDKRLQQLPQCRSCCRGRLINAQHAWSDLMVSFT